MKILAKNNLIIYIVLFFTLAVFFDGLMPTPSTQEHTSVYCSLGEMKTGAKCPPKSQPFERAKFKYDAIRTFTRTVNRTQALFYLITLVQISTKEFKPLTELLALLWVCMAYTKISRLFEPPDAAFRKKINDWARLLTQSPAIIMV